MTETKILSVPLRMRLARRERSEWGSTAPIRLPRNPIRDYHAAAQGAPVQRDTRRWRRRPVCRTCPARRGSRSYFMRLVRLSYLAPDIHQGDPRWAAAGRFDGREAPRALPSAAGLALISGSCSALLERDPNLKINRSTA